MLKYTLLISSILVLTSCFKKEAPVIDPIPAELSPIGDGFNYTGDPCRILGENEYTADYLGDSTILVGCPADAKTDIEMIMNDFNAEVVNEVMGIVFLAVPDEGFFDDEPAADDLADDSAY